MYDSENKKYIRTPLRGTGTLYDGVLNGDGEINRGEDRCALRSSSKQRRPCATSACRTWRGVAAPRELWKLWGWVGGWVGWGGGGNWALPPLASPTSRCPRQRRSRACGRSSSPPRASSAHPWRTVSPPPPPPSRPPHLRTRSQRNPTSAPGLRVCPCCRADARPPLPAQRARPGSLPPPPGERTRARRHAPAHRPPCAPQLRCVPGEHPPPAPTGGGRCSARWSRGGGVEWSGVCAGVGCTP